MVQARSASVTAMWPFAACLMTIGPCCEGFETALIAGCASHCDGFLHVAFPKKGLYLVSLRNSQLLV